VNNLQRGGGPQTAAGKTRSSQNAVKHGITSNKMFVLQNENPAAWEAMLEKCVAQFNPITGYEQMIIEEIAFARWRLRRLFTIENALFDIEMDEQADALDARYDSIDEGVRKGHAFKSLAETSRSTALMNRYQARLERSCQRLEKSFYELRAAARADAAAAAAPEAEATPQDSETENAKRTSDGHKIETSRNFARPIFVPTNTIEVAPNDFERSPMPTIASQIAQPPYKDVA
jgi:hypothetical protein